MKGNERNTGFKTRIDNGLSRSHRFQLNNAESLASCYRWQNKQVARMIIRSRVGHVAEEDNLLAKSAGGGKIFQFLPDGAIAGNKQSPVYLGHALDQVIEPLVVHMPS